MRADELRIYTLQRAPRCGQRYLLRYRLFVLLSRSVLMQITRHTPCLPHCCVHIGWIPSAYSRCARVLYDISQLPDLTRQTIPALTLELWSLTLYLRLMSIYLYSPFLVVSIEQRTKIYTNGQTDKTQANSTSICSVAEKVYTTWRSSYSRDRHYTNFISLNLMPPAPLHLRTLWRYTNAVIVIIDQLYTTISPSRIHCSALGNISFKTRNTFCGTWYLPHSHVHN